MIYTRFGSAVTISAYCGKHRPGWAHKDARLVLVRVRYEDDGKTGYRFTTSLKADGGWQEIDMAVDEAPEIVLSNDQLLAALKDAE